MGSHKVDNVNKESSSPAAVFEAIHAIMHLFRAEQYRVLRDGPHDLTHMEGKLMGFFAENPGATLRDTANVTMFHAGYRTRCQFPGFTKRRIVS